MKKENNEEVDKVVRDLQVRLHLAEALKAEYSIMWESRSKELREIRELLRQTNDDRHKLAIKELENQKINKNLWVCLLICLIGNLFLIYLSFYLK